MLRVLPGLALGFVVLLTSACERAPISTPELQAALAATAPPRDVPRNVWPDVQKFYAGREQRLAWLVADGVTEKTQQALGVLRAAASHGLDPASYGEPQLQKLAASLASVEDDGEFAQTVAQLDISLTARLLVLARHVATGRLSGKSIDARWNTRREPPDYIAALQNAAGGDVSALLEQVQPRHPEYRALRTVLASLQAQAASGWPEVPRVRLKIGQRNMAVIPLRQRLRTAGFLPATASLESLQFDTDVEAAVKAFQEHHGLAPSGVLDPATVDRMNVPLASRIKQVAMNLERWRWLPDDLGQPHFLVNVPDFHLFAREHGKVVLDMRVVVGKRGNETPLFSDEMETVVFSPYWNVPETIALEETAPAVAEDPEFLARNNMEIVNAAGEVVSPEAIPWGDESALANYRFRQRPGAQNALGFVKFLFPNKHAVYLHDTPADDLFKRIGRAFSHGCVRVEQPERLAKYVLRDQPEWTEEAIRAAMRSGTERHVKLTQKIPVHIVYMTAWVDEHGGLHFGDDVYGYDARRAAL